MNKILLNKAVKVWLLKKDMARIEFIVATASYLLAESTAREALKRSGLNPADYPYTMLADVEIIKPD